MDNTLPADVRPEWLKVIRRLQSVAKADNHGLAVLNISVLVDSDGKPIQWSEPRKTLLEPKANRHELLELLTKG